MYGSGHKRVNFSFPIEKIMVRISPIIYKIPIMTSVANFDVTNKLFDEWIYHVLVTARIWFCYRYRH